MPAKKGAKKKTTATSKRGSASSAKKKSAVKKSTAKKTTSRKKSAPKKKKPASKKTATAKKPTSKKKTVAKKTSTTKKSVAKKKAPIKKRVVKKPATPKRATPVMRSAHSQSGSTVTATRTKTISSAQLAVATIALALAGSLAFAAAPLARGNAQWNHVEALCHDGARYVLTGDECRASNELRAEAREVCGDAVNPKNGKTGVRRITKDICTPKSERRSIFSLTNETRKKTSSKEETATSSNDASVNQAFTLYQANENTNGETTTQVTIAHPATPTLVGFAPSTIVLSNGVQDLYEFAVQADGAGDIMWAAMNLTVAGNCAAGIVVTDCINDVTLYRLEGSSSRSEIETTFTKSSNRIRIDIANNDLETVTSGSESRYIIEATLSGFADGDAMTFSIEDLTDQENIGTDLATLRSLFGFTSPFLWSDNSGVDASPTDPHWFNGHGIEGLPTRRVSLVKPT